MAFITSNQPLQVRLNSAHFWSNENDETCKAILVAYVLTCIPWRSGSEHLTVLEMMV